MGGGVGGGGSLNGGKIYGTYPPLYTGSDWDIVRGRLLPTTSVDEYCMELASWFGVQTSELDPIFPNYSNFHPSLPIRAESLDHDIEHSSRLQKRLSLVVLLIWVGMDKCISYFIKN